MFNYFNHVKHFKTLFFPSISDAFHWITPVASVLSSPFDGCGRAPKDLSDSHGAVSMKGNSPDQKPRCPVRAVPAPRSEHSMQCLEFASAASLLPSPTSVLGNIFG